MNLSCLSPLWRRIAQKDAGKAMVFVPMMTISQLIQSRSLTWLYYLDVSNAWQEPMTEKELRKLEGTIRTKMNDIRNRRIGLKESGIGSLMNLLKQVDEALYEKILPEYKEMVTGGKIFKWCAYGCTCLHVYVSISATWVGPPGELVPKRGHHSIIFFISPIT